ncbi:L-threonylcarbamoyladenylate synthase [Candidatus Pelagibacter sp.]|jgi:L-threonylcarbamoyladenylate synthase|uniref:L-threonylcarbamoyladenylate synthase n=1 Tax=Candidatus Pelagibacter sp. TaxID=2024849 RepID=UPI000143D1A2|nr:translation factor SUA5 [alpha proteobacterium HIMB5]REK51184.1 MAG: threonylcarbamoyl-AMP synthase [Pseudomonadota bacterium]|tara:strand:+ start:215 stop:1150 length:936 start_codon:yes stop_codon:yes gene_type:complete
MKRNYSNIKKAKYYLDNNECVAIPTETVYGLAGNAYSSNAVKKIFKLKKRPSFNPLIVHYSKVRDLQKDCEINQYFIKLYKKFCPGPLTFVLKLKKNSQISKYVTNKKKTLAVRFPKHSITRLLLKNLNYPLAAPSANLSTKVSAVEPKHINEDFGNKIKFILKGKKSKIGIESTIIDLTNKPKILRLGGLEIEKIEKEIKTKLHFKLNPKKISAPGQLKLHYSPGLPIKLNVKNANDNVAHILINKRKNDKKNFFYLSKKSDLKEAAKNLYSTLRKIKKDGYKRIAVEKIPKIGLGLSINDRLNRAAKFK